MTAGEWLDVAEASTYAKRHRVTLWKALESGQLHGQQRMAKGKWLIARDCMDAWIAGQPCDHQAARARAS